MTSLLRRPARSLLLILVAQLLLEPAAFAISQNKSAVTGATTGVSVVAPIPSLPGTFADLNVGRGVTTNIPNVHATTRVELVNPTAPAQNGHATLQAITATVQNIENAKPADTHTTAAQETNRLFDGINQKGEAKLANSQNPTDGSGSGSGSSANGGGSTNGSGGGNSALTRAPLHPRRVPGAQGTNPIFPGNSFNARITNNSTVVATLKNAQASGGYFALTTERSRDEGGTANNSYPVATLMKIVSLKEEDGATILSAVAVREAIIERHSGDDVLLKYPEMEERDLARETYHVEQIKQAFETMGNNEPNFEMVETVAKIDDPQKLSRVVGQTIKIGDGDDENANVHFRQMLLGTFSVEGRLSEIAKRLAGEVTGGRELSKETKAIMDKANRDYYLRTQIEAANKLLGNDKDAEVEKLEATFAAKKHGMNPDAIKAAETELAKARSLSGGKGAEYHVSVTYLERLLAMPWGNMTAESNDLSVAEKQLADDHEGLEEIKERVLEFLAIRQSVPEGKGVVLAFDGPPGVGKTSISISIAKAMGLKFYRLSLGGVRDEAEIRGHRRTYIGALPGKITEAMRKTGVDNPAILLDEIDKMSSDQRGDPASAMLEVLDPSQNHSFRDHYLDVPYDLSKVFFMATSNVLGNIPGPLRDRMEIIQLGSYTEKEKLAIAANHLIAKQMKANGLLGGSTTIEPDAILAVIRGYTREGGVRNLEREIGTIMRKIAVRARRGQAIPKSVDAAKIKEYLGEPRMEDYGPGANGVGQATGLAWTQVGGDVLAIETLALPKGATGVPFAVSGQLKEVMTESAQISRRRAILYATSHGVSAETLAAYELSLHVPDGATPKDGPSAGITMLTALVSRMTGRAVKPRIAMTGELTLSGRVTAIGGLKEKALAALRFGYDELIVSTQNEKDVRKLPKEVREAIKWHFVDTDTQVLDIALEKDGTPLAAPAPAKQAETAKAD